MSERVLLRPKPGTFYSVDALAPDVVRFGGRYLMFFSGNFQETVGGDWRTGLAIADHPWGPYRVATGVRLPFYNGGTMAWRGRLLTAASGLGPYRGAVLFSSSNGRTWRRSGFAPQGTGWGTYQGDFSLDMRRGGYDLYFTGRPGASGADLGVWRFRGGWRSEIVLGRRNEIDLGGASVFRAGGSTFMTYGSLPGHGAPRHIELARRGRKGWHRCGPLVLPGRWYPRNAIDPEPLVVGKRLYLFFGGGTTSSLGGWMEGKIGLRIYRLPD